MTRGSRPAGPPARPARRRRRRALPTHPAAPARPPPTVTSLLDVQHLDLPQMFSRAERAFRAVAWPRSVRSSDRVIVISEFVRDRAVEKLGLDPDLIRVIHLGVDHERLGPGPARARSSCSIPPGAGRTRTTTGSLRRSRS